MIETLAQKRMHLVAFAALLALIAAMFVVLAPTKAQSPYAAVSLLVDFPQDSDDTIAAGTSTQVRLRLSATDFTSRLVAADDAVDGDWGTLSYDFTYTPASALNYIRASDGLILKIADEAGVVLAGNTTSDAVLVDDAVAVALTPASTAEERAAAHTITISESALSVIVPAGVDDGSAVISASVVAGVTIVYREYSLGDHDSDPATPDTVALDDTGDAKSIFIPLNDQDNDDPTDDALATPSADNATRVAAGTLNIGSVDEVNSIIFGRSSPRRGSTDPGTSEPAFVSTQGGTTEFTLHILNANDKPSQVSAVSSIVVSTTSGTFSSAHSSDSDLNSGGQCGGSSTTCELEPPRATASALPTPGLKFLLAAASRSGTADIRVVVISRAGTVLIDDSQQITFHGPAAEIAIGDASGTVLGYDVVGDDKDAGVDGESAEDADDADSGADTRDQISFSVDAVDKAGTTVATPTLSAKITGPDGKAVSSDKFEISQSGDLSNTLHLDIDASKAKKLAAGAYQIKVSAGALSDSGSFTAVGTAEKVVIVAGEANEDGQIEVEVMVHADDEGTPVADGTTVNIQEADLRGDGDKVLFLTSSSGSTDDGVATATFIEIGPGRAAIIATADGKTDVARVVSTFGAEVEDEAPTEPGLGDLSRTAGLASYSGPDTTASALMALLAGRATALWLSVGDGWSLYASVDGVMVPGSVDFTVTSGDVLYIAN